MTAKAYLNRIRTLDLELKCKEHELERLRADSYSLSAIDYAKDRISGGGVNRGDLAGSIARISDLMLEINQEWNILIRKRAEARICINQLETPIYRVILTERYLLGRRWEDIAVGLNYSWKGVFKIHSKAIKEFERVHGSTLP